MCKSCTRGFVAKLTTCKQLTAPQRESLGSLILEFKSVFDIVPYMFKAIHYIDTRTNTPSALKPYRASEFKIK